MNQLEKEEVPCLEQNIMEEDPSKPQLATAELGALSKLHAVRSLSCCKKIHMG